MDEQTNKRPRWSQFGLRTLFTGSLVVGAFLGGHETAIRRADEAEWRQSQSERHAWKLLGIELYSDDFAEQVKKQLEPPNSSVIPAGTSVHTFFQHKGIALEGLPEYSEYPKGLRDVYALSPHYALTIVHTANPQVTRVASIQKCDRAYIQDIIEQWAFDHVTVKKQSR